MFYKKKTSSHNNLLTTNIITKSNELKSKLDLLIEDPSLPTQFKIHSIITLTSATCAIVAVQPIPFADIFILSPIQVVMVTYLAKVIGLNLSNTKLKEILVYLTSCVGWGILSQQFILSLYKTIIPFAGGFTTIPLVYACTYGLGIAAKTLLENKMSNSNISKKDLKFIIIKHFKESLNEKVTLSSLKEQLNSIDLNTYKIYKNEVIQLTNKINFLRTHPQSDEDFQKAIIDKTNILKNRYSKYPTVAINPNLFNNTLVLATEEELRIIELFIAKLYRKEINLKFHYDYATHIEMNLIEFKISKKINSNFITEINIKRINDSLKTNDKIHLQDKEIRNKFIECLYTANYEIDIRSPWVSKYVVDENFINLLENALERGVIIKISYDITDSSSKSFSNHSRTNSTITEINSLKSKLNQYVNSGLLRFKNINSHYKLLICDNEFYIEGSFNLLSFKGDYTKDCRHEGATLGTDKDYLISLRKEHFDF